MKAILQILATCFIVVFNLNEAKAQDSLAADSTKFFVEELPKFPGGNEALAEYLMKNVKYPKKERRKNIEGTAYVRFVIDKSGEVRDVEILPGTEDRATEAMKEEAIRVVGQMPNWAPGRQRGKKVHVQYTIPIMFKLR